MVLVLVWFYVVLKQLQMWTDVFESSEEGA